MFARRYATKGDPRPRSFKARTPIKRTYANAGSRYASGRRGALGFARARPQTTLLSRPPAPEAKSDLLLQSLICQELGKMAPAGPPLVPLAFTTEGKEEKKSDIEFDDDEGKTVSTDLKLLKSMIAGGLGASNKKVWHFRIGGALNASSNGAGIMNVVTYNSVLSSNTAFATGLAALFDEFFIVSNTQRWMPNSLFQYPESAPIATQNANSPMGVVDLQNNQAAYTNMSLMNQNPRMKYTSTGMPFTFKWSNVQRYKTSQNEGSGGGALTQTWTNFPNVVNYTGGIQLLTSGASPVVFSSVLGTLTTTWHIVCRIRS